MLDAIAEGVEFSEDRQEGWGWDGDVCHFEDFVDVDLWMNGWG